MKRQIRPIVEFFPLDCVETKRGGKYELFADDTTDGSTHRMTG